MSSLYRAHLGIWRLPRDITFDDTPDPDPDPEPPPPPPPPGYSPDPVRSLAVVGGDGFLDVVWKAPLDDGGQPINAYEITWVKVGELPLDTDTGALGAPANLRSPAKTTTTIDFAWDAATESAADPITGYQLRFGTTVKVTTNSRTALTAQVTGLTAATSYPNITVRAVTLSGVLGPPSPSISVTTASTGNPTRPFIAYSGNQCFLKSLLSTDVATYARDTALTTEFKTFMSTNADQRNNPHPWLNGAGTSGGAKWGMVWALATASDPVWKLTGTVPTEVSHLTTTGFHGPEWLGATLTGTSDSPMVVSDPVFGFTMWASGVVKGTGYTINCSKTAGSFWHNSNGLDRRNKFSTGPKNFRSRGSIPDAMVVRHDMLTWAIANNSDLGQVIHCFFVQTEQGWCHPVVGDETEVGWGIEGLRVAIRPDVDLTTRGMSAAGLAIARTLQRYGMYLGDNTGSPTPTVLKLEQESAAHPVWGSLINQTTTMTGITWDDWFVVPPAWPEPREVFGPARDVFR